MKRLLILPLILAILFSYSENLLCQFHWERYADNPVLEPGETGEWDENLIRSATVIFHDDTYLMWYSKGSIGYATSPDGINWIKYESNPVMLKGEEGSWDANIMMDPKVLFVEDEFHMYYSGHSGGPTNENWKIGHATSPDGINWTKDPNNPVLDVGPNGSWDDVLLWAGTVLHDGSLFHMWYSGWDGTDDNVVTGHATSEDGVAWTKDPNNPVLTAGTWDNTRCRPGAMLYDGVNYHSWYNGGVLGAEKIGYAISEDGSVWTKKFDRQVMDAGAAGTWDAGYVFAQTVIFDSTQEKYKMWYIGRTETSQRMVGYAESFVPKTIHIPADYATIQEGIDAAHKGDIVVVADGTYYENINFKGKAITVASQFLMDGDTTHISKTVIDGSQPANPDSASVVLMISGEDTTSVLTGFTITGGTGTIVDFEDAGTFRVGGGVFIYKCGAKLMHNIITGNTLDVNDMSTWGAGVGIGNIGGDKINVIIRRNVVHDNMASTNLFSQAGGIGISYEDHDLILVEKNIITDNKTAGKADVPSVGAGIAFISDIPWNATLKIKGNTITGNEASGSNASGGGLFFLINPFKTDFGALPYVEINNNIFAENSATSRGGAMIFIDVNDYFNSVKDPVPIVMNNTMVGNTSEKGSGICIGGIKTLIFNNILWNEPDNELFSHDEARYFIARYNCIQGGEEVNGNINKDPLFKEGTYELDHASLCIGSGIDSTQEEGIWYKAPPFDFKDSVRPHPGDMKVDMGAIESSFLVDLIDRQLSTEQIMIYPNPTSDYVILQTEKPGEFSVEIRSSNGQLIYNRAIEGSLHQIDMSRLNKGVYFVMVRSEETVVTEKIIKL